MVYLAAEKDSSRLVELAAIYYLEKLHQVGDSGLWSWRNTQIASDRLAKISKLIYAERKSQKNTRFLKSLKSEPLFQFPVLPEALRKSDKKILNPNLKAAWGDEATSSKIPESEQV